ncbi:12080_t:CDS:1, partial [Dentiscutata erythropus]
MKSVDRHLNQWKKKCNYKASALHRNTLLRSFHIKNDDFGPGEWDMKNDLFIFFRDKEYISQRALEE